MSARAGFTALLAGSATLLLAGMTQAAAPAAPAAGAAGAAGSEVARVEACRQQHGHGQLDAASRCYAALRQAGSAYLRAEGAWGAGDYESANREFRAAVARADGSALYRARWGLLLHERFNDPDAMDLFKEALQREPKNTVALMGLARVSADGFDDHAADWARKALEADPGLAEAHELLADLALEDSDPQAAAAEADTAMKLSPEALDAMAIHASIELLGDRSADAWWNRLRAVNPVYGEGYATAAKHLILNRRYDDGVALYRQALAVDPQLWAARSELGINLMRLGQDTEAQQQLLRCYQAGYRDGATVNSLRLLNSLKGFITDKDDSTILRLNPKESDLLYPYFHDLLVRSLADYSAKYHMKLDGPVQVEVYPDHEDFAVRTEGMPGLGALGVTFGNVVAMDSPSGRKPGEFHWASTLRHELSHVFILSATRHRVPRWFTEGLAVHEETQASPEWGDPMTPQIVVALRDHKLLPVTELDRGFIHPTYDGQVIVSYFQAGRICDWIQQRWGAERLMDMVKLFAVPTDTARTIQTALGLPPEQFDRQFQDWLYGQTAAVVAGFDDWHKGLSKLVEAARAHRQDEVLQGGEAVIALYPDYVYDGNAYELLAQARLDAGDAPGAIDVLQRYVQRGGRQPETLDRLAKLQQDAGDAAAAAATLDRINWIDPVYSAGTHRRLGELWLAQGNATGAVREFSAVLAMQPQDAAQAHYDLARAHQAAGNHTLAEDEVLAALEAAPGFRPAQKLLLELKGQ